MTVAQFDPDMTLREARDRLRQLVDEGHECPCCTQMAKVYRRKINSTMARALITLYRAAPVGEFVHAPSLPGDTHEISQLAWWGMAAEEHAVRPDGGRTGWWALTAKGGLFVEGRVAVSKYARIYDSRLLGLTGEQVMIRDCLGSRFNYTELMSL